MYVIGTRDNKKQTTNKKITTIFSVSNAEYVSVVPIRVESD